MKEVTPNEPLTDTPEAGTPQNTPSQEAPTVSVASAKKRRRSPLPLFKTEAELRCDVYDHVVVDALRAALKAGCSRLFFDVAIPQCSSGSSQTEMTTHLTAKSPQYVSYRVIETYMGGFWGVQDVATKDEALAAIAERRGQLKRGYKLQVIGVRTDGGVDGYELLQ